jgi:hypothetical protein
MARVRLNLRNLSVTDKIAKGRQIVTAMTNNATFPTPNPPLTEVTGTIDDLEKWSAMGLHLFKVRMKSLGALRQSLGEPAKQL